MIKLILSPSEFFQSIELIESANKFLKNILVFYEKIRIKNEISF